MAHEQWGWSGRKVSVTSSLLKKEAEHGFGSHSLPDIQGHTKITWLHYLFLLFSDRNELLHPVQVSPCPLSTLRESCVPAFALSDFPEDMPSSVFYIHCPLIRLSPPTQPRMLSLATSAPK